MNRVLINIVYLPDNGQVKDWLNMPQKRFDKVKQDYSFYNSLLEERKSIFSEVIEVNKPGNNKGILSKEEKLNHSSLPSEQMVLIVDVKVNNHDFFQFKLRYKEFIPAPFFRFDSDGDTHRNRVNGIPLEKQSIPTPHFHKFNHEGVEIAYQTDKLLDPKESKALEDINICIIHFFHESNTRLKDEGFPEISIMSDSLGLKLEKVDPNQNVNFL
jgi:hypothetical protein